MKFSYSAVPVAALFLSACMATTEAPEPTVVDPLVGKRLLGPNGTVFEIKADGTMGGVLGGDKPIVGVYTADDKMVCSTYSAPEQLAGKEFCSTPQIDGGTVIFHREDGSKSPAYTIEG